MKSAMYLSVLSILAVSSSASLGCRPSDTAPRAAKFETTAWQRPGRLSLRLVSSNPDMLLLRHEPSEAMDADSDLNSSVVYRYQIGRPTLQRATVQEWNDAAGPISECDVQEAQPVDTLRIDERTAVLHHRERIQPTAGRTALCVVVAPSRDRAAVLSADGPRSHSVMPAIGRGGASGAHYHEVFALSDGAAIAKPVPIPLSSAETTLGACWSADGRRIVYFDVLFRHLCIVESAAAEGGNSP